MIDLKVADVWRSDDGVVWMRFKPCETHTLEDAIAVVKAHNDLAGATQVPVIADIREVTVGANRQAREHYVSEESSRLKLGMAMLVKSPMQRMLGNVFFRINRPPYPSKMFLNEAKALDWLKSFEA